MNLITNIQLKTHCKNNKYALQYIWGETERNDAKGSTDDIIWANVKLMERGLWFIFEKSWGKKKKTHIFHF